MTVRVGIAGIRGRMGREIAALAAADPQFELVGGLGRSTEADTQDGVRVNNDAAELLSRIEVLIDFTTPAAAAEQASACADAGVALVTGTTGLDAAQVAALREAAKRVAIFQAANMSPGVNAAMAVLPALARALAGYDVEIVEAHHRDKADAPSGTALALARVVAAVGGGPLADRAVHGREGARRRAPGEIGIHALRGGGNPGEHAVIFSGDGEEIRVSHRSFDRSAYARGALRAARLIVEQPPGWYEPATLAGYLA